MNASQLSTTTGSAALTMNRQERIKRFGIECLGPGGGDGILLGYTNVGAGPCNSTLALNGDGYAWQNIDNLIGPFTFTVIW